MYAFLADLHLGVPRISNIIYLKTLNRFFEIIKNEKEECHAIFVCGDLFDHRLNIDEFKFVSIFLTNLVCNNCGKTRTHVPVHFIHGTYSHDYEQYEIFMPLLQKIDNTDVFYTKEVCSGTSATGNSILYLPQIYGKFDYSKFFNDKHYDIIVGHGPLSSTNKNPCKASDAEIIHSADQLGKISDICVFGHYHGYTDFGNNVYYAGPWLRWQYGEDEKRRFLICDDKFNIKTFDNPFAVDYKTIDVSSPDELRNIISSGIDTPHRFIIKSDKNDLETYHSIITANKKNQNLKYNIISEEVTSQSLDDVVSELSDISNNSDSINDPIPSLIDYIKTKYDIDASNEINEYSKKINKDI